MSARPLAARDVVALLIDVASHDLARGHVGTVLGRLADGSFQVEFGYPDARPPAELHLQRDVLLLLHHAVIRQHSLARERAPGATSDLPSWEPPPPSDPDPHSWDAAHWDPHYAKWPGSEPDEPPSQATNDTPKH